jgi:hypothetical protein
MRRLALVLVCGLLAGGGAGAVARKAPPHHRPKHPHKHHKHTPARKPAVRPVTAPATTTPQATTPAEDVPPTTTPTDTGPPAPATAPAVPLSHALGVTESDTPVGGFSLSLSRTQLGGGTVTVSVRNISQDSHDLRIETTEGVLVNHWDELPSGTALDPVAVSLTRGTYRIYCTLPGHAAAGMDKQITVLAG